jgi:hypothetical protein
VHSNGGGAADRCADTVEQPATQVIVASTRIDAVLIIFSIAMDG